MKASNRIMGGGGWRRHGTNLVCLAAIQLANALLPLAIFPYLVTVLGAETYAQLAMAEALAVICLAVVIYSFDIDGVGEVVALEDQGDAAGVSRILSRILASRLTLFLGCVLLAVAGVVVRPSLVSWLLLAWMLMPLSFILQPNWLFQALEDNVAPAVAVVASRLLAAGLVVAGVRSAADCWRVPVLVGVSYLLGAIATLIWARRRFGLHFEAVSWREIRTQLRRGREVFLGNLSVALYRDFNVVLLGTAGVDGAGIAAYSLAEKVTKGVQAAARPLNQVFFPRALQALRGRLNPDREALRRLWRFVIPQWLALAGLIVALGAGYAAARRFGLLNGFPRAGEVALLVGFMLPAVFLGVGNFILGSAGLNHLGARDRLLHAILAAGLLNLPVCLSLARGWGSHGAALSFVLAEAVVLGLVLRNYLASSAREAVNVR